MNSIITAADRMLFGEGVATSAIAVVLGFSALSLYANPVLGIVVFMGYLVLVFLALVKRRTLDLAFLLGMYYLTRFQLGLGFDPFRYVSDLIAAAAVIAILVDLVLRRARLRWWDGLAIALVAWMVGVSLLRHIPLGPLAIQVRALFALYPVYVLMRERGFAGAAADRVRARFYFSLTAWWLFLGTVWEKVFDKQVLPTLFVQNTGISPTNWPRVYGWAANPNTLGAVSVLLIVLGVALAGKGWSRKELGVPVALLSATLMLTVSRSAFWGLAVFAIALVVFRGIGRLSRREALVFLGRWLSTGIAIGLVAVVLSMFVPSLVAAIGPGQGFGVFGRFITGEDELEQSQRGGRLFSLKTALSIVTESPSSLVMGQGLATYGSSGSKFWASPLAERFDLPERFYADFFYGMLWVESGIFGLLGFLLLIAAVAWGNKGAPMVLRLSLLAITFLWFLFYNVPEIQGVWFLLLLMMGTGIAATRAPEQTALEA